MKKKWLWLAVALAVVVLLTAVWRGSSGAGQISPRLVGQSVDATGQLHIVYEIRNGRSVPIDVTIWGLQEYHERTGWWDVPDRWSAQWDIEPGAGGARGLNMASLNPGAKAKFEFLPPHPSAMSSAVRGKIWHIKEVGRTWIQLRSIASRWGVPRHWLMWPKPEIIYLPGAELAAARTPVGTGPRAAATPPIAQQPAEEVISAGSMMLRQTPLPMVLEIYAELARARLEIDAAVRVSNREITLEITQSVLRADALRLMEQAMQQQAGVEVQRSATNVFRLTLGKKSGTNSIR